jgi:hypothetical protein
LKNSPQIFARHVDHRLIDFHQGCALASIEAKLPLRARPCRRIVHPDVVFGEGFESPVRVS